MVGKGPNVWGDEVVNLLYALSHFRVGSFDIYRWVDHLRNVISERPISAALTATSYLKNLEGNKWWPMVMNHFLREAAAMLLHELAGVGSVGQRDAMLRTRNVHVRRHSRPI